MSSEISVVIPVYGQLALVENCVRSLLDQTTPPKEIIVVDDCSPETGIEQIAALPLVRIARNLANRGYTDTVNQGVSLASGELTCIANSDLSFSTRTIEALARQLRFNRNIWCGVGPLSNAASYQSVPFVVDPRTGRFSANESFGATSEQRESIAELLASEFAGQIVDFPVLNGCCSLFFTEDLHAVGMFDDASFPVGYGEENDLCIRLTATTGRRLGVCLDAFVYHVKSASFGSRRDGLAKAGRAALEAKYGKRHLQEIDALLRDEPAALAQVRARLASLTSQNPG